MAEPKVPPKSPVARETKGEGAPKRRRNEGTETAEERAEPERGNERVNGRIIERERDAQSGRHLTARAASPPRRTEV